MLLVPKSIPHGGEQISILAIAKSDYLPDYSTALDRSIQFIQKEQPDEFKLVDGVKKMIDNTEGEQIIYRFLLNDDSAGVGQFEPFLATAFKVYFQKENVIFEISAYASRERVEQTQKDFEHILKGFKV